MEHCDSIPGLCDVTMQLCDVTMGLCDVTMESVTSQWGTVIPSWQLGDFTMGSVTSQWSTVIPSWGSVMSQLVSVDSELGKTSFITVFCDITIGLCDVSKRVCIVNVRLFDFQMISGDTMRISGASECAQSRMNGCHGVT